MQVNAVNRKPTFPAPKLSVNSCEKSLKGDELESFQLELKPEVGSHKNNSFLFAVDINNNLYGASRLIH